jgi:Matrixin
MREIGLAAFFMAFWVSSSMAAGYRLLELDGHVVKWGTSEYGVGTALRYSFVQRPITFADAINCMAMVPVESMLSRSHISDSTFRAEVRKAFDAWEKVADVRFEYVGDPTRANILIGAQARPRDTAFANVWHSDAAPGAIAAITRASICYNPILRWEGGLDGNVETLSVRQVTAHEIGHAIGLDHPGGSGQLMGFRYSEEVPGLRAGDVLGALKLYGPPRETTSRRD